MADTDADQDSALSASRTFKQLQRTAQAIVNLTKSWPLALDYSLDDRRFRDFAILAGGQPHITRGHDGGNGMFIDHLTHAIPE